MGSGVLNGGTPAQGWIESFRRDAARLRAEACPEEFADRLVALAEAALETAGQQMAEALASRDVIGQAKGVLMERHKIGADEAFDFLKRTSQRGHARVRVVAEQVVASVTDVTVALDEELRGPVDS